MSLIKRINFLDFTLYQVVIILGIYSLSFPFYASVQLFGVFANLQPLFACNSVESFENITTSKYANHKSIIPTTQNCSVWESCPGNVSLVVRYKSAASDLGLYCDQKHSTAMVSTIQMSGLMVGSVVFGQFSDSYGRRLTCVIGVVGTVTMAVASTFATSWQSLAALRFFTGFGAAAFVVGVFTVIIEITEPHHRMCIRSWLNLWGHGRLVYALVAWLSGDWRTTFRVTSLLFLPVQLLTLFLMRDPLRWLIQHGRVKQAQNVAQHLAKINCTEPGHIENLHLRPNQLEDRKYGYKELFVVPKVRNRAFLSAFLYFACACVSYGMDLKTGYLPGNIYVNQIILSCSIILGKPIVFFIDRYIPNFNRRRLHQISMGMAVTAIAIVAILEQFASGSHAVNMTSLAVCMVGIVVLEWQWDAVNLLSVELFPTVVRCSGLAFSAIVGRLGNVVAPQVVYLSHLWAPAAYIVFIALGIISIIISVFFLPETKGLDLPDGLNLESIDLRKMSLATPAELNEALIEQRRINAD